jgi:hypothetical protein
MLRLVVDPAACGPLPFGSMLYSAGIFAGVSVDYFCPPRSGARKRLTSARSTSQCSRLASGIVAKVGLLRSFLATNWLLVSL